MESLKNYEYFERSTPNILEKLIKEQGDQVCQEKIGIDYIKDRIKDYDFGFARTLTKASIGQRRTRQNEKHLYSFVLCKKIDDDLIKELDITLVCSRKNAKDGKELMELVEKRAKELHVDRLSLIAIGDTRLLRWYESIGYICVTEKPYPNSRAKAYSMRKRIYTISH